MCRHPSSVRWSDRLANHSTGCEITWSHRSACQQCWCCWNFALHWSYWRWIWLARCFGFVCLDFAMMTTWWWQCLISYITVEHLLVFREMMTKWLRHCVNEKKQWWWLLLMMIRDQIFTRSAEFIAEPWNSPVSAEFLFFRGILQNSVLTGDLIWEMQPWSYKATFAYKLGIWQLPALSKTLADFHYTKTSPCSRRVADLHGYSHQSGNCVLTCSRETFAKAGSSVEGVIHADTILCWLKVIFFEIRVPVDLLSLLRQNLSNDSLIANCLFFNINSGDWFMFQVSTFQTG